MQHTHKKKETVAEKGDGSRRQEVKDSGGGRSLRMGGESELVGRNWGSRMDEETDRDAERSSC